MFPAVVRVALLSSLALPHASASLPSARCSLVPGFVPRTGGNGASLLVVPMADTLLAGRGSVEIGTAPGHMGSGRRERIHGQRFTVLRSTNDSGAEGVNRREAIMVPWDYDAVCQPVPWPRTARWLPRTDTLVVTGVLRRSEEWASGLPTYDVTAVPQSVYTGHWSEARGSLISAVDSVTPVSSPADLVEALRQLPSSALVLTGDEHALDAMNRWALEHGDMASLDPVVGYFSSVRQRSRTARLMSQSIPFVGTWELVVRDRDGGRWTRWLRTAPVPLVPRGDSPEGPSGFNIQFNMADSLARLPTSYQHITGWGIEVRSRDPGRERHWRFTMELEEFRGIAPAVDSLIVERGRTWAPRGTVGEREPVTGEIALTGAGGALLRITWDTDLDGRPDLVVSGYRVSAETLAAEERHFQRW